MEERECTTTDPGRLKFIAKGGTVNAQGDTGSAEGGTVSAKGVAVNAKGGAVMPTTAGTHS